jgi:hypothetical protein
VRDETLLPLTRRLHVLNVLKDAFNVRVAILAQPNLLSLGFGFLAWVDAPEGIEVDRARLRGLFARGKTFDEELADLFRLVLCNPDGHYFLCEVADTLRNDCFIPLAMKLNREMK